MTQEEFTKWINKIFATEDKELDCTQLQDHLPAYVEAKLSGVAFPSQADVVEAHLNQCPDCRETYLGLHYVLEAEANNELPQIDWEDTARMPAPSLSKVSPVVSELSPITTS